MAPCAIGATDCMGLFRGILCVDPTGDCMGSFRGILRSLCAPGLHGVILQIPVRRPNGRLHGVIPRNFCGRSVHRDCMGSFRRFPVRRPKPGLQRDRLFCEFSRARGSRGVGTTCRVVLQILRRPRQAAPSLAGPRHRSSAWISSLSRRSSRHVTPRNGPRAASPVPFLPCKSHTRVRNARENVAIRRVARRRGLAVTRARRDRARSRGQCLHRARIEAISSRARSLRLAAQDVALSRRKQGFESPRERQ
jgi:hypothetical protein